MALVNDFCKSISHRGPPLKNSFAGILKYMFSVLFIWRISSQKNLTGCNLRMHWNPLHFLGKSSEQNEPNYLTFLALPGWIDQSEPCIALQWRLVANWNRVLHRRGKHSANQRWGICIMTQPWRVKKKYLEKPVFEGKWSAPPWSTFQRSSSGDF